MALSIEIVARSGHLWSGQASYISVPLSGGEMGILPGRAPVLASVGKGELRVTPTEGALVTFTVQGGFCSVDHDVVTVAIDFSGDEIAQEEARLMAAMQAETE